MPHMFFRGMLLLLAPLFAAGAEAAPYADAVFKPPLESKDLLEAQRHPLPQNEVEHYLDHLTTVIEYDDFKGYQRPEADGKASGEPLRVGEHLPIDLAPEEIFWDGFADGKRHVFLGAIRSLDAERLRLEADIAALAPTDELWVIDPTEPRAFGPYGSDAYGAEAKWLASVSGDTAVLLVRSETPELPLVYLHTLSHFLQPPPQLKAKPCNINIACEEREGVLDIAAGVGVVITPTSYSTGTLINNPDQEDPDPIFLTAEHSIGSEREARNSEIVWDYRAKSCGEDDGPGCPAKLSFEDNPKALEQLRWLRDEGLMESALGRKVVDQYYELAPSATIFLHLFPRAQTAVRLGATPLAWLGGLLKDDAPSFSSLPRSEGNRLLAADGELDISLVLLDDVPDGPYGRTYAGWDTRRAEMDEQVITLHYPNRSHMRISYGHVTNPKEDAAHLGFKNQIRVLWEEGITEPGSSGSPLLAEDSAFRIMGVLSNGGTHSCQGYNNWDRYASFREFYPSVKDYVTGTAPISAR